MEYMKREFLKNCYFQEDERKFFEQNSIYKELKRKECISLREIKENIFIVIEGIVQIDELIGNGENVQITFLGEKNFSRFFSMINRK